MKIRKPLPLLHKLRKGFDPAVQRLYEGCLNLFSAIGPTHPRPYLVSRCLALPKLYIPSTIKTQVPIVPICFWVDLAVSAVLKISAILLKHPSYEVNSLITEAKQLQN